MRSNEPNVTVVIPCFNDGEFLGDAVTSVRHIDPRGERGVELIIVNDGSVDPATLRLLSRFEEEGVQVIHQRNSGLATARNIGIRAASGRYILPLDADNRICSHYFSRGVALLNASPDLGVVYGDAEYFGLKKGRWKVGPFDPYRLLAWNYIDACALFRKSVWIANGGYDSTMPVQGFEDWDFWLTSLGNGFEFHHLPAVCFEYRVREGSMISSANSRLDEIEAFLAKKHGILYRKAYLELEKGNRSLSSLSRRLLVHGVERLGGKT